MTQKEKDKQEARATLLKMVRPGDTLYTVLRHVSNSGMSRLISVHTVSGNEVSWLTYLTAKAAGLTFDQKKEAIRISGCGMDMGFQVVYQLGCALWPEGFTCAGEAARCPSNDHSNGDRDYKPHTHKDGGYALRQRWL